MSFQTEFQDTSAQLYELVLRAKKINYKNKPPHLPKRPTESTMMGFRKRLSNWTNCLLRLEEERMRGTISSETDLLRNYRLN